MNYLSDLVYDNQATPISYWANTSDNAIIYDYINQADSAMKHDFDTLVKGDMIVKEIKEELTYREMNRLDNIYSFLLFTGYLKYQRKLDLYTYELLIPNKEVMEIYKTTFKEWFKEENKSYGTRILNDLLEGNSDDAMNALTKFMETTVSYYDTLRENSYHMLLTGLLNSNHLISNRESGDGRFDLAYIPYSLQRPGFMIEFKVCDDFLNLHQCAQKALNQIEEKGYLHALKEGYTQIHAYGIAFYQKRAYVLKES